MYKDCPVNFGTCRALFCKFPLLFSLIILETTSSLEDTPLPLCPTEFTLQQNKYTSYLEASFNEQSGWVLHFSLSKTASGFIYLADGAEGDILLISKLSSMFII